MAKRQTTTRFTMAGFLSLTLCKTGIIPEVFDVNERLLSRRISHFISAWVAVARRAFDIILFDSLSHSCARLVTEF